MALTDKQRRFLRQQAHHLKPVVLTGQHGLTDAVIAEVDQALEAHELIKVRLGAGDREARREMADTLCQRTGAEPVQSIGRVLVLYRWPDHRPARIELP